MSKSIQWTKAKVKGLELTPEERAAVLVASSKGFALLSAIIKDKLEAVQKERVSKDGYASPSWALYQADLNGEERAYRALLDILGPVCYNTPTD